MMRPFLLVLRFVLDVALIALIWLLVPSPAMPLLLIVNAASAFAEWAARRTP